VKEWTNRSLEQNREPRNRTSSYSHLIFDKGAKAIQLDIYLKKNLEDLTLFKKLT
jgi:hypothetical protein